MAGSLAAPPTLAQVQEQFFSREALLSPVERQRRRADFEHAALLERQQRLQQVAPASGVAWALVKATHLPAVPLDPASLEPVGEAVTDPAGVLTYWTANPGHAVGVRMGAHQAGRLALVGVRVDAWAGWQRWRQANGVESERLRPWSDLDPRRGDLETVWRSFGAPCFAVWMGPAAPSLRMWSSFGDGGTQEDWQRLRNLNVPDDLGGFMWWTVGPVEGRLPAMRGRSLGDGLTVLADSDVVPLWAATAEGRRLQQDGLVREPYPTWDCPAWLLDRFGAKWVEVAASAEPTGRSSTGWRWSTSCGA